MSRVTMKDFLMFPNGVPGHGPLSHFATIQILAESDQIWILFEIPGSGAWTHTVVDQTAASLARGALTGDCPAAVLADRLEEIGNCSQTILMGLRSPKCMYPLGDF